MLPKIQTIRLQEKLFLSDGDILVLSDEKILTIIRKEGLPEALASGPPFPCEISFYRKLKPILQKYGPLSSDVIFQKLEISDKLQRQTAGQRIKKLLAQGKLSIYPSDRKRRHFYTLGKE